MSEGPADRIFSAAWTAATAVPIWFKAIVYCFIWGNLIAIGYLVVVGRDRSDDVRVGIHIWVIAGLLGAIYYLRLRRRERKTILEKPISD